MDKEIQSSGNACIVHTLSMNTYKICIVSPKYVLSVSGSYYKSVVHHKIQNIW